MEEMEVAQGEREGTGSRKRGREWEKRWEERGALGDEHYLD